MAEGFAPVHHPGPAALAGRPGWPIGSHTAGGFAGMSSLRYCRSMEDVRSWFSMPRTGTVETAAAPFWRLIPPSVRIVTVRRPPAAVIRSAIALGYNARAAERAIGRADAKLDQIEARRTSVRIEFDDLASESGAKRLWEAVLPLPFDAEWYARLASLNIQYSAELMQRYVIAHEGQLMALADEARRASGRRPWVRPLKVRQKELFNDDAAGWPLLLGGWIPCCSRLRPA